jgi:tetrahydromethanopterin S-methyltransferase subunit G
MSKDKEAKRKPLATYQNTLDGIREAATRVNEAASTASDDIEALEKELGDIEPGVTVWTAPIYQSSATFVGEDERAINATRVIKLGFGKSQKWGLLVSETYLAPNGSELGSDVQLLRKAERDIRLLAHPHLGLVLEAVLSALNAGVAQLPAAAEE